MQKIGCGALEAGGRSPARREGLRERGGRQRLRLPPEKINPRGAAVGIPGGFPPLTHACFLTSKLFFPLLLNKRQSTSCRGGHPFSSRSPLFPIIPHYSPSFPLIPHYSSLFPHFPGLGAAAAAGPAPLPGAQAAPSCPGVLESSALEFMAPMGFPPLSPSSSAQNLSDWMQIGSFNKPASPLPQS